MTELGWIPPSDEWIAAFVALTVTGDDVDWPAEGSPNFSRDLSMASPDTGEAARLVVGALRTLGARLSELTYWVGRNGDSLGMKLPELGI
ncbi:hypothetical protein [Microtetraspora sp. NBRC 13810]|uniref:hypothetical protein n=1 Tax=Microtetraspora sp. NBRC 13810 TaxID=3030990 RepID=UPI00255689E7|nr:hypothetical protein [Microtetraspora sp. NBRC 13810]